MGVSRRLKEHDERIKVYAAEPNLGDSVQGLRNLDDGFVPAIFERSLLDSKIMIDSEDSIRFTQELLWREGIFAGVSAGAALQCAVKIARRIDRGNIVVLFADGGWKYLGTDLWTAEDDDPTFEAHEDPLDDVLWW